jgi:hypothetical protein
MKFKIHYIINTVKYIILLFCTYLVIFRLFQGKDEFDYRLSYYSTVDSGFIISISSLVLISYFWWFIFLKKK